MRAIVPHGGLFFFAPQGTSSVVGVGYGRIANTCDPGPSEHHQTNDPPERALCAVHHSESRQGTPLDGKSYHVLASLLPLHSAQFELFVGVYQLRSTKQLLGRAGERFLLFGMLVHSKEGKLCLEDLDGVVELDFSQLVRARSPPSTL